MKIKLPDNAEIRETANGLNDTIIKIKNKSGWDILHDISECNGMKVIDFVKLSDPGVYSNHVIICTDML